MTYSVTSPDILIKQPADVRQFSMNFTNLLSGGETISSISSSTIKLLGGGTSNVSLYDAEIDSTAKKVTFWVSGGTDNTRHRIEILVVTSAGQTIEGDGILAVRDT